MKKIIEEFSIFIGMGIIFIAIFIGVAVTYRIAPESFNDCDKIIIERQTIVDTIYILPNTYNKAITDSIQADIDTCIGESRLKRITAEDMYRILTALNKKGK